MSARSTDIFGGEAGVQPAEAGSYGEHPRGGRLPAETRLGVVRLRVSSLDRSIAFYQRVLGMRAERVGGSRATLAAEDGAILLELEGRPGTKPSRQGSLGLYHFAILLPDRASLGRFVRHLGELGMRAGAGDHLVSEAFYLTDPDGLGIEIYADRPRADWRRRGNELMMATDPVDVASLVRAAGSEPWSGMPAGTVMGHVHLHVGELERAADFYSEGIGFDRITWSYPGALFMSAGGYHHHLGTNTWAGSGASPAADDEARLLEWTIELPTADALTAVADRLAAGGHAAERAGDALATRDPWGTGLRLRVG